MNDEVKRIDVGVVTAFADAKRAATPYPYDREKFRQDLANLGTTAAEVEANRQEVADNTQAVADDKADVEADKASVEQSAAAAAQSAENAHTDALAATAAKEAAQTAKGIAVEAKEAAASSKTEAENARTEADTSAEAAAGSALVAGAAAQAATEQAQAASGSAAAAAQSAEAAAESARTLTIDTTLTQAGQAADAKKVGDAVADLKSTLNDVEDAVSNKVNITHNLVNYGYANQERTANSGSSYSYERIGVKRVNTNVVLNLAEAQTSILYIKISGNIQRSNTTTSVRNWSEGITLTSGHCYRASLKYVSGTIAGTTEPYITMSVYKVGESSSIGDVAGTGVREFTADSDPINLALYIYKGTTFNNAVYQVILEDLTELYSHSIYPKITVTKRNAILNLIDAYMAHDTDTVYNTSVTWNYYVTKERTYSNNKLQVCCSSFAQLIWGGISPDTFFNDPTNYDGDIIKTFTWGYEMPFTARRKAGGLAIRENNVITGYYGLHTGDTNKETYSYTTYYNAGSSENLYSQRFKTFMYAADMAAELAMLGYEIPIGEADVGDLIFYRSAPYALNPTSNNEFKQITHVAVVIGKTDGYFDVAEASGLMEGVGIYKTSIASENPLLAARAAGMAQNIVMAVRHPAVFGVSGNVPTKFVTIPSKA